MPKSSRCAVRVWIVDKPHSNGLFWLRGFELQCATDFNLLANRSVSQSKYPGNEIFKII